MAVVKLKNNRRFYFKSTNFLSTSQIVYRIKANSRMLSIIAILSAITVTMICATFVLYSTFAKMGSYYVPFSFLSYNVDDEKFKEIVDKIEEIGEVKLLSASRFTLINAVGQNPEYAVDLSKDTLPGEKPEAVYKPGDPFDAYIMSSSDYKQIIKNLNVKTGEFSNTKTDFDVDLKDDECFFIDRNMEDNYCKNLTGEVALKVADSSENYKIVGVSMHKYLGVYKKIRRTTIVLSDKEYEKYLQSSKDTTSFMGLMFDYPMNSKNTVEALD